MSWTVCDYARMDMRWLSQLASCNALLCVTLSSAMHVVGLLLESDTNCIAFYEKQCKYAQQQPLVSSVSS